MTPAALDGRGLVPPTRRPPIPDGPQSVRDVLDRPLAAAPDAEALVGRHQRHTYRTLDDAADRAAHALAGLGVRAGDRVAASVANQPELVVAFLGAMRIGAIWVGLNRPLAPKEKAYMLRDAQVGLLLAEPGIAAELAGLRDELPDLRRTVVVEPGEAGCEWAALLGAVGPAPGRPPADIDPFAPAAIAYTSGTTGFPKGAVHSQHNLLMPGAVNRLNGQFRGDLRQGVALPLTILNLMVLCPLLVFQVGGTCVTMDRSDAVGLADWIRRERIATFSAVPAMLHDLLTHPDVRDEDLASLTRPGVGGADCPESFRQLYRKRFGTPVVTGYGLTEAPTAVTLERPDGPMHPGSSGQPLVHVRITIRDEDGAELPDGEVGEVCVEPAPDGPWAGVYTPFLGYWNRPEATAEALRGGILHTADLGYIGADGCLFIKDRKADLIIRGGANVYPAEVERVLHADPRVAACAVVGKPDERLGERVAAFVQLMPGASATAEDLRSVCLGELARYKVPEDVIFVDDFPRNPMGKIVKPVLRAQLPAGVAAGGELSGEEGRAPAPR